ncbi:phosphoribosylamine--glycine ligase [Membranihabitans marinus]|uniref:phosphoribosylamine--glycine ligase n=1 Tax=Membranihabitans marinus TaxID=1227546 RepID=UPI001F02B3AC|nr:phosphoribosylamine--glycine ligase [Membranihabitans marinus]
MNILILGNGGREHALAWKLSQSPLCDDLYIAPGNAGTQLVGKNLPQISNNFDEIKQAVVDHHIELVIVGPEAPLVEGVVDFFLQDETLKNVDILGPDQYASQLEGSKSFAKDFMARHNIPTAKYIEVTQDNVEEGLAFLQSMQSPYVLKADGLAAGKGVLIIDDVQEAEAELKNMLNGKFGAASSKVVIEEFLDGIEFSVFVLVDGERYVILPEAKDYKRIGEGDTGLNTGGMGSVSPVPFYDEVLREKVISKIVEPTVNGFKKESMHYRGFVFLGLIMVGQDPMVIEYNCRMGDPETQSVMVRMKSDLLPLCLSASRGELKQESIDLIDEAVCTVVAVSGGYPGSYEKGKTISGTSDVDEMVFFAGAITDDEDNIVTSGGRVLAVTAKGSDIEEARQKALKSIDKIEFEGINYRKDIGKDLL